MSTNATLQMLQKLRSHVHGDIAYITATQDVAYERVPPGAGVCYGHVIKWWTEQLKKCKGGTVIFTSRVARQITITVQLPYRFYTHQLGSMT